MSEQRLAPTDTAASRERPGPAPVAIRATGFTYRYPVLHPATPPRTALASLDFTVPAGQVVGVVGPSGSGLTTLCLALAGIVPHETGGVVRGWLEVAGEETTSVTPAELARRVGIVFEDPEANLIGLSVADEVAFALELAGLPPEEVARRVDRALALVGLGALRERPAGRLSGGQKQRLALAVALAREPEVLVLDQPTAQLDPQGKRELLQALASLVAAGDRRPTLVLAERDTDFLLPLVERLFSLAAGHLALDLPAEVAFTDALALARLGVAQPQLAALAQAVRSLPGCQAPPLFRTLPEAVAVLERCRTGNDVRASAGTGGQARQEGSGATSVPVQQQPLLRLEQVSFGYGDGPTVLHAVDLSLGPGELVALVGPNGSGKTTLARHVIGALRPTAGRVLVAGRDTRQATIGELAQVVGYVAQNPDHQLVRATPREEVAFALRLLGADAESVRRRAETLLRRTGLGDVADVPLALLSRGQRQLVAIVAALAREPQLLVLDEPTSALDRFGRELLATLLAERVAAGGSVLLVSHDLRFVAGCADRVVLLHEGVLRADGSPRAVLGDPELLASCGLDALPVTAVAHELGLPPALEPDELVVALRSAAPVPSRRANAPASLARPASAATPRPAKAVASRTVAPFLARLDPRVKLALAVGAALPVLLWQSPLLLFAGTVLLHLALGYAGGFDRQRLAEVWRALAPLLLLVLLLRPLFDRTEGPVLVAFGPLVLTLPALLAAIGAALRLVALALLALAWFATTSERALVQSLVRLGLPTSIGLALAIGLRFVPVFAQTFATAAEALQTRGWIIPERGMARLRALLPVLSVALAATLRQAQQLAWVLTVRGVGARGNRPRFGELRLQQHDRLLLLAGLLMEAVLFVATLAGLGRSPLWPWG
jgi:energy-coupling factor transport system ATP-binding protein